MNRKWARTLGLLLLCVYAAAVMHQVLPSHCGHESENSCPLCHLLAGFVLFVAVLTFITGVEFRLAFFLPVTPFCREFRYSFRLRGPPQFLLS